MLQPTLASPVSQLCTQSQCEEHIYEALSISMGMNPRAIHRKQWEFVYLAQVLRLEGLLKNGSHGIGFGVGQEPLPTFFASKGVSVLATDLPNGDRSTWAKTGQWGGHLEWPPGVDFAMVDMNDIPEFWRRGQFDFAWSACSMDHLGSLDRGLDFIRHSLECVRPGGLVAHTTEFNLSSDEKTLDHGPIVFYRQQDILKFKDEMEAQGHEIDLDLTRGIGQWDGVPHDGPDLHLCVELAGHIATSIGLVIRKGEMNGNGN